MALSGGRSVLRIAPIAKRQPPLVVVVCLAAWVLVPGPAQAQAASDTPTSRAAAPRRAIAEATPAATPLAAEAATPGTPDSPARSTAPISVGSPRPLLAAAPSAADAPGAPVRGTDEAGAPPGETRVPAPSSAPVSPPTPSVPTSVGASPSRRPGDGGSPRDSDPAPQAPVAPPAVTSASAAEQPAWATQRNKRRGGAVLGTALGYGIGGGTGYPNKASEIGDPAYYTGSGLGIGGNASVFILSALTDYLNFGVWFGGGQTTNSDWRSSGAGGGFRVEAFPFYDAVPALKDLGIATQLGVGKGTIRPHRGTRPGADGTQSYLGATIFYEWRLFSVFGGHVAIGPSLDYSAVVARSMDRHSVTAGGRFVLYTAL